MLNRSTEQFINFRARENGRPCPVPMCDAMRKEFEEAEVAVEI